MDANDVLEKHEKMTSDLSGTKVRISEKGARRQMVEEAMEDYAYQCVMKALKLQGRDLEEFLDQWRIGGA